MVGEPPAGRLLERETELGVIGAALGSARCGSGSALLVEGPAGIGKTSLLAHACAQAVPAGAAAQYKTQAEVQRAG